MDSLVLESSAQHNKIDEQRDVLDSKEHVIGLQRTFIYLFVSFIFVAIVLSIIAYRQARKKHVALKKLKRI